MLVRKPTRPKLTPRTGTPVPRKRCSARSIVPSPPSTIARSASSPSTSSTPASRAICSSRLTASATRSGLPWTTRAARLTGIADPVVELVRQRRLRAVDEVEEELSVALWPWQARIGHADRRRIPLERRLRDLAEDAAVHLGRPDDPALHLGPTRLELRLDEHDGLPPGLGQTEHGRQRLPQRDERHVGGDQTRRIRQ